MDYGQRIKEARISRELTRKELASIMNVAEKTIYNYETNKAQVTIDFLATLSEVLSIDYDYLVQKKNKSMSISREKNVHKLSISESITPASPQDLSPSPTSPLPKASISPLGDAYMTTHSELYPILEGECDPSDLLMLPVFVNGRVSCRSGEPHNEGDIYFLPQSKSFLKTKFNLVSTGALGIIQAIGNSMHPTIDEGDLLLFQCDGSSVEGGIYIIELEGDYLTKRLIKRPTIKLISDNPIYEPIELQSLQEIRIIGRVVGVISNLRL